MLIADNLYKEYHVTKGKFFNKKVERHEAVKGANIKIEKGQIVGLLGVNGAGKTTIIKMLTTMISPSSGTILIDDIDAVKKHMDAKKKINLITGGERNIYWRLTAKENLEYFGSLYGIPPKELEKKIIDTLKIVDLESQKDIAVEKYSKGMKQRLQIARGLINNPEYLFMDEPTLGLDIIIMKSINQYIKKLAHEENKGVLITTHYIHEAEELCDYIYVIDQGKIIAEGSPEKIKQLYTNKSIYRFYLDSIPDEEKVFDKIFATEDNEIKVDKDGFVVELKTKNLDIQKVITLFNDNHINIINLEIMKSSLEDALLEIIER